ncbi:hypothetical protein FF38_12998 [Lucilia cuprina]|uniref:snRNA-activating protein complex subunit 4 n=1 Tax=Lucilia cuprina TaxID=7375 RepID=A0A0L0C3D9_LUCCU|nr:Myb-like protein L [Lucilia cuprina]KNC26848.1 hypothetical protein FF38_12998 [Lucilia cuprina]
MANSSDMNNKLEEALFLNRKMQTQLLNMREKLEKLLSNVKDHYKINDLILKEGIVRRRQKGIGIKGAYLKGGTFYLKGNMFFKDINCRNCPNNPDYERRKLENEMFPMDLNLKSRHVWSTTDKQGVILGIKEQIIDYLTKSPKRRGEENKELDSEKLAKLLNMVPKDFCIDWDHLSSHTLQHRHSAKTCEAIWNLFLHPTLKRTAWTEKENQKLLEAAKKYNFQNWQAIANEVGHRSDFQCFVQYKNYVWQMSPDFSTKWSKEDDKLLLEVIAKNNVNGIINWSIVNAYFPHKAKNTLHSRYNHTLNPEIRVGVPFTPEEDLLLIAAVKEYGKKFNCIPRTLFPNRSLIQLRTHYNNVLCKRHNHHPWSLEDDIKLMEFVTANGTKSWMECEKSLDGKHSRISCRTRFLTIRRYLEKNPDASIEDIPRKKVSSKHAINIENWKEKVEELAAPEGLKLNNETEQKTTKSERTKKLKAEKIKRTKKEKPKQETNPTNEEILTNEHITPQPDEVVMIQPITEGLETKTDNTHTLKLKTRKSETENNKPLLTLKTNSLENYNFFKYAYNFKMNKHPCDNVQLNNEDMAITMSALDPQIPLPIEKSSFDSNIPDHVKLNIANLTPQPSFHENLERLPPSWSTTMGFRALCIHTAGISTNLPAEHFVDETNNFITKFRERLRTVFYSTALLSRLNPGMVGINTAETQTKAVKRKRSYAKKDNEKITNKKIKCIETIENIKTELET